MNTNGLEEGIYTPQFTADGSFTFFSEKFGESFHSHQGAEAEALLKFIEPTLLREKAKRERLYILDICYGLGYNTGAALETIWQINPNCVVEVAALESDLAVPQAAIACLERSVRSQRPKFWDNLEIQAIFKTLAAVQSIETPKLKAKLWLGDARDTLQQIKAEAFLADAIFLDPFSPPKCPQLWTVEFLQLVSECLKPDGRIATYSCAAAVRQAFLTAKLHIGATNPVGRRSPGTVASLSDVDLPPLSVQEREHLLTKAAVPYTDPNLQDSAVDILKRREEAQKESLMLPTSQWKKRYFRKSA